MQVEDPGGGDRGVCEREIGSRVHVGGFASLPLFSDHVPAFLHDLVAGKAIRQGFEGTRLVRGIPQPLRAEQGVEPGLHCFRVESERVRLGEQHAGQRAGVAAVIKVVDEDAGQAVVAVVLAGVPGEHPIMGEQGGLVRDGLCQLLAEQLLAFGHQGEVIPRVPGA